MFMAFTLFTVQKLHSCCWCCIAQQIHRGDLESKLLLELVVPSSGRSRVLLSCYGVNFIMRMYRTFDVIRLDKSRDETISNLSRQVKLSTSTYDFRKFVIKIYFRPRSRSVWQWSMCPCRLSKRLEYQWVHSVHKRFRQTKQRHKEDISSTS